MKRRVHVLVRGRVQGVGYRYTLRSVADAAGVSGWTRNRGDDSVETEIEGTPDQVDAVLAWMGSGPPGARVDAADVAEISALGESGFEVRPSV
jgi:acylphosphatase